MREADVVMQPSARVSWQEIERRLRPFVARRLAEPSDLGDVLQEIYLRIQRSVGALRDTERFGPWVYQVARSALADHGRARARHPLPAHPPAVPDELSAPPSEEEEGSAERELARSMAVFVAALPLPYREAITLTELQGMTQKDAAELLGLSLSGMKSRVQRGRRQIQQMLQACCHIALDARGHVLSYERRADAVLPESCCDQANRCKC
jgi:RNA polymerase sigma-70 factor (ECF subfamily)